MTEVRIVKSSETLIILNNKDNEYEAERSGTRKTDYD